MKEVERFHSLIPQDYRAGHHWSQEKKEDRQPLEKSDFSRRFGFFRFFLIPLVFLLLASLFFHGANALNQDLGRHLKTGEIIWQTKEVPKTNLFSWTEPESSFVNHHWLAEVFFYVLYSLGGIKALVAFMVLAALASFYLVFFVVYQKDFFFLAAGAAVLSAGLLMERTDIRPEIFGFLGVAFFWAVLSKNKEEIKKSFWLLLPAQFLWANLHITFCFGLAMFFFFFLDRLWARRRQIYILARREKKIDRYIFKVVLLGVLLGLVTFLNPNTWRGALYPLAIFRNYGYTIVENQSPFFLDDLMANPSIFIFKLAIVFLVLGFVLNWKKFNFFHFANAAFFGGLSCGAIRYFPFLGLAALPVLTENFSQFCLSGSNLWKRFSARRTKKWFYFLTAALIFVILIGGICEVVSNRFFLRYHKGDSFGWGAPAGASQAVNFLLEQKITGRMFNNFDIGGYLIWQLYPERRVFVDNRPEAYSEDFFQSVYIPMQNDAEVWRRLADEVYKIDYVFFAHTDATPWADNFIRQIARNQSWKMIYADSAAAIWVKNEEKYESLIKRFGLDGAKVEADLEKYLAGRSFSQLFSLAVFWEKIGWLDSAIKTQEYAWQNWPHSAQAAYFLGSLYAEKENWPAAESYLTKAIDLDKKSVQSYSLLGQIYYSQGDFSEARRVWQQALEAEPENQTIKMYLDNMGLIPFNN